MDTSNISHSDLEDFEQELLRRNAAIDSQGAAATEAAEAALRYQVLCQKPYAFCTALSVDTCEENFRGFHELGQHENMDG